MAELNRLVSLVNQSTQDYNELLRAVKVVTLVLIRNFYYNIQRMKQVDQLEAELNRLLHVAQMTSNLRDDNEHLLRILEAWDCEE